MRRHITLLVLVGWLTACATNRQGAARATDEAQIRALVDRGTRALETHSWDSYAAFWANDADIEVMHPAATEWVVGWDSVAAKYRRLIADTSTSISAQNRRQHIHLSPSRDMAWVTQEDILHIGTAGREVSVVQWSTAVYEKRNGQWRLVHAHASIPPRR